MVLSPRFALDTTAVLAGAFLAVSAETFTASTAGWLSFGVSAAAAVAGATAAAFAHRTTQKAGHGLLAAVGLWSLIAALTFTGQTLTWLVLANGIALVVAALADLTAHELTSERVVHQLDVRTNNDLAPARSKTTVA